SVQYMGAVRSSSVKRLVPLFSVLLGVLCLGESLNLSALVGMALIFAGFGVLVWESKQKMTPMDSLATDQGPYRKTMRLGMVYGVVSAGAYATGNMSRKFGLLHIPEPAFGAMMGALVGAILFVTSALFLQSYREAVKNTLQKPNPWLLSNTENSGTKRLTDELRTAPMYCTLEWKNTRPTKMVKAPAITNQARPSKFKSCRSVPPPMSHTTPAIRTVINMDKKAPLSPPW
ncbi:MAG: EamA family transporter, partial [Betaproteobacteria bacterium]|nr:EamA family transporter [Betaproteobacteria bacterium]